MTSREVFFVDENGELDPVTIILTYDSAKCGVHASYKGEQLKFESSDYFECLILLRKHFESQGVRIKCNGSRYDVYPSRMSREMSHGIKAYTMTLGKQASRNSMVNIFDEADLNQIVSVEEQKKNYDDWLKSLG